MKVQVLMFLFVLEKTFFQISKTQRIWGNTHREIHSWKRNTSSCSIGKGFKIELKPRRRFYDFQAKYSPKLKPNILFL